MKVRISSGKVPVSDRLDEVAREKIGRLDRFLEGLDSAEVRFQEESNPRIVDKDICEVTLKGHGHHVRCKVAAPDQYAAVDRAVDKLEHQLHKLKTRVLNRHHGGAKGNRGGADAGVDMGAAAPGMVEEVEEEHEVRIVKTKKFEIDSITPEEAIVRLELVHHDFYFFTNEHTGGAAIVYRRADGDYGLIDKAD